MPPSYEDTANFKLKAKDNLHLHTNNRYDSANLYLNLDNLELNGKNKNIDTNTSLKIEASAHFPLDQGSDFYLNAMSLENFNISKKDNISWDLKNTTNLSATLDNSQNIPVKSGTAVLKSSIYSKLDYNNVLKHENDENEFSSGLIGTIGTTAAYNYNKNDDIKFDLSGKMQYALSQDKDIMDLGFGTNFAFRPVNLKDTKIGSTVVNASISSDFAYSNVMNGDNNTLILSNKFGTSAEYLYSPNKKFDLSFSGKGAYTLSTQKDTYEIELGTGVKYKPFEDKDSVSLSVNYKRSDYANPNDSNLKQSIGVKAEAIFDKKLEISGEFSAPLDNTGSPDFKMSKVIIGGKKVW